jgi:hypothetical protein
MMRRALAPPTKSPRRASIRVAGTALFVLTVAAASSARQAPPGELVPRPTGTGVIRGRVVDPVRGTPVARVTVTASQWRRVSPAAAPANQPADETVRQHVVVFKARTSADGSFAIASLPPGEFNISVQREGYGGWGVHRNQHVTLSAGATVVLPEIRLPGGGVITGRVLDPYGEPVIRASVVPIGWLPGDPESSLGPMGSQVFTDDRGRYRLYNLRPGAYTVHVTPPPWRGGTPQGDARQLLPGVAGGPAFASAEFVDVAAAEEATLDVRLREGLYGEVAGSVLTDTGGPAGGVAISLRPADVHVQHRVAAARSAATGTFQVSGVPPGRYLVVAEERPGERFTRSFRRRTAWCVIEVDGARVDGVSLTLTVGAMVGGRIEVEGGDAGSSSLRSLRLAAQPITSGWPPVGYAEATFEPDALTFAFPGLHGPHRLTVNGLPRGWWVKSVTIDGRDVWDGYDFPARGAIDSAVVVLSARPTGVEGRVENVAASAGDRGAARPIALVLPRDAPSLETAMRGTVHISGVLTDGTFRAEGVRPGSYAVLVVAPDVMETLREMTPAQMRALVDAHGITVDVAEGRFTPVTLRVAEP